MDDMKNMECLTLFLFTFVRKTYYKREKRRWRKGMVMEERGWVSRERKTKKESERNTKKESERGREMKRGKKGEEDEE
ncbi:hypothetical protein LguiA_004272 [Lonicera macranthoides]